MTTGTDRVDARRRSSVWRPALSGQSEVEENGVDGLGPQRFQRVRQPTGPAALEPE
jgi:hypothetical protein